MDIQKRVAIAMSGLVFAGVAAFAAGTTPAFAVTTPQLVNDGGAGGGGAGGSTDFNQPNTYNPNPVEPIRITN